MHKSILIVEDNGIAAMELQEMLYRLGYSQVNIVKNYTQAMQSYTSNTPDLILLDIDLREEKNGIDIAKEIRKTDNVPIIYLTADNDEETIKKSALTHPSNYINKPFEENTLRTALLLALCTHKGKSLSNYVLSALTQEYSYNKATHTLYHQNTPIHLTPSEISLIEIFIQYPRQAITADMLTHLIWEEDIPIAENALRNLIYRLNKKLPHKLISHVPTQGYKLNH